MQAVLPQQRGTALAIDMSLSSGEPRCACCHLMPLPPPPAAVHSFRRPATRAPATLPMCAGVRMLSPTLGAAAADRLGHQAVPLLGAGLVGLFLVALQLGLARIPLPQTVRGRWGLFGGGGSGARGGAETKEESKKD